MKKDYIYRTNKPKMRTMRTYNVYITTYMPLQVYTSTNLRTDSTIYYGWFIFLIFPGICSLRSCTHLDGVSDELYTNDDDHVCAFFSHNPCNH